MWKLRPVKVAVLISGLLLVLCNLNTGAAPSSCSELVKNGNFEAGSANWTQEGGNGVQLINTFKPHKPGNYSADLGGDNNLNQRIRQQLSVPGNSIVTLSFWWTQETQETVAGTQDYLAVNLLDSSGRLLKELARLGADPDQLTWQQPPNIDMSAYAGQTVQLQFQAVTDAVNPTEFWVDDVSVTACTANRIHLPLIRR